MALPTSRDVTLAPGSQFPSALGNKLQDMVIGGKHGEVALMMPAASFWKTSGAGAYDVGDLRWEGACELSAGLPIPCNSSIVKILYGCNRGGAGTINLRARSVVLATEATLLADLAVINSGTGYAITTVTNADIVAGGDISPEIGADTLWHLAVSMDNAAHIFRGCIVYYKRT